MLLQLGGKPLSELGRMGFELGLHLLREQLMLDLLGRAEGGDLLLQPVHRGLERRNLVS